MGCQHKWLAICRNKLHSTKLICFWLIYHHTVINNRLYLSPSIHTPKPFGEVWRLSYLFKLNFEVDIEQDALSKLSLIKQKTE